MTATQAATAPARKRVPRSGRTNGSTPDLTPEARAAAGRAARKRTPRSVHADWSPAPDRKPVDLLMAQDATRLPELVPLRWGRMLASPFTFYRGSAALMAADICTAPSPGLAVQLCGDAHLSNFGGFASPDRDLVFDINDFDETLPGPFEWDVKRLGASVEIAGRDRKLSKRDRAAAVMATVAGYREALQRLASMGQLDAWYLRLDERSLHAALDEQVAKKQIARMQKTARKARSKDRMRALERLTERVDGSLRIVNRPPLVVPVEDLLPPDQASLGSAFMQRVIAAYSKTLSGAARRLMDTYTYTHMARKVVGVGSVGTRAWIVLLTGRDDNDPLFLQVKEAQPSVLEPYAGRSRFPHHGRRVVEGQWMMQAASDIFLGWVRATGIDGVERDFYVRQLWDWKASAEVETMDARMLATYGRMCGWTLAHGHARSGDAAVIAGYLGNRDTFDRAIAAFSAGYADQAERDFAESNGAVTSGRIETLRDV